MCLKPITINSPSKYVSLHGGQLYSMLIPCGECAECKKLLQTEYRFRAYYQVKRTFDLGGYVYFDTLTYAPEHLPHVSEFLHDVENTEDDYSCFRLDDYRKFFVRLRRMLSYHGFNAADNLKYFLTSEYGTSETGTHRPHYHVLFFVTDPTLDPFVLSHFVNRCWQLGRTDGIDYQPKDYVLNHIFSSGCDQTHLLNVCNYVAKYVTKDSYFEKIVSYRIDKCLSYIKDEATFKSERRKLRNVMCQFHRLSKGFGEYGLTLNELEDIMKTGMISMPSSSSVVVHTPLPAYFKRKLFYDLVEVNGKREWQLNELGKQFVKIRKTKAVELMAHSLEDWFNNIQNFVDEDSEPLDDSFGNKLDEAADYSIFGIERQKKSVVDEYRYYAQLFLGNRTWKDFAEYLQLYKGRIIPNLDNCPTKDVMLDLILKSFDKVCNDNKSVLVYNYSTACDRMKFGSKFVCSHFHGDAVDGYDESLQSWITNRRIRRDGSYRNIVSDYNYCVNRDHLYKVNPKFNEIRNSLLKLGKLVGQRDFARYYCIDENTYPQFRDFDKLYSIYCKSLRQYNKKKQEAYDERLRLLELNKKMIGYKRNI